MDASGKGQRSELLDVLSDVKTKVQDKLGFVEFPIPQFIIVGKQSVGKSRLIEALAGEQFNFISGTLGSRRPTVLEFRNIKGEKSKWFHQKQGSWSEQTVHEVMKILGDAHESLGASVSKEPVHVRVESPHCVDMQVVDLPGFRDFALDEDKQALADSIESMVTEFMEDTKNVMLCVEEAGDAANLSTLTRCKRLDPSFKRTVLIRNKLDKYYRDLTSENVNEWLNGFGDLPTSLPRFAVTLPHWKDGQPEPPKPFVELRSEMDAVDIRTLKVSGASAKFLPTIGYIHFAKAMEKKIEKLWLDSIGPVLKQLKELRESEQKMKKDIETEVDNTNPSQLLTTARSAGKSFGDALSHVMEGVIRSEEHRMTLEDELRDFHRLHAGTDEFDLLPSPEIDSLDEYIRLLREEVAVPAFDVEINGGGQYRRLVYELEVFVRFAELCGEAHKRDVIQARGVAMQTVTWREVVVKLLINSGHIPMRRKVRYVAARIKHFFQCQKPVITGFMGGLAGSADQHMYSGLYSKQSALLAENEMLKKLVYDTYDGAVERQFSQFIELFDSTLASTFANPWVFLKKATMTLTSESLEDVCLPCFEDSKARIPEEIDARSGIEAILTDWLAQIPAEPSQIDEAVNRASLLLLRTHSFIRAQVADQVELYTESFFKLPMMRRLEETMADIELSESDKDTATTRLEQQKASLSEVAESVTVVTECIHQLQAFQQRHNARI